MLLYSTPSARAASPLSAIPSHLYSPADTSTVSSPPGRPAYGGGEGGCMATCIMLSSFHTHPLRGPRRMSRPRHHLYEGRMGRRGQSPLSHTNAGTRDNTWQQAYRPAIIVVARSLLSPMSMYGRRFLLWGKGIKGQSHGIKKNI